MNNTWREVELQEIAEVIDSLHQTPSYVEDGLPMVRVTDIKGDYLDLSDTVKVSLEVFREFTKKYKPRRGDILFSRVGSYGNFIYVNTEEDFCLGQNTAVIVPKISPRYLFHALKSPRVKEQVDFMAVGSTQKTISLANIKRIKVLLPSQSEIDRIADILGTLTQKIELNRRMNPTLEAMARALFQSWFVDFDPVHAKARGETPYGMDEATAALFPDNFEETALGRVPKGWQTTQVKDLALINANTLGKNDVLDMIDYIEISEVNRGEVGSIKSYSRGEEPSRARRRLSHGDTVISTVRPDRAAYFLAMRPLKSLIASTGFAVVTPQTIPYSFIHLALTKESTFEDLGRLADGAAYPAVNASAIADITVIIPDHSCILDEFHRICEPIFEQMHMNRGESRTLAALRDTLLPKLVSGELPVPLPIAKVYTTRDRQIQKRVAEDEILYR